MTFLSFIFYFYNFTSCYISTHPIFHSSLHHIPSTWAYHLFIPVSFTFSFMFRANFMMGGVRIHIHISLYYYFSAHSYIIVCLPPHPRAMIPGLVHACAEIITPLSGSVNTDVSQVLLSLGLTMGQTSEFFCI